jgi:hypothetical protein
MCPATAWTISALRSQVGGDFRILEDVIPAFAGMTLEQPANPATPRFR